jgi:hypothetical protein
MINDQWIGKDTKGSGSGLFLGNIPECAYREWGKPRKISDRIAGLRAELGTWQIRISPENQVTHTAVLTRWAELCSVTSEGVNWVLVCCSFEVRQCYLLCGRQPTYWDHKSLAVVRIPAVTRELAVCMAGACLPSGAIYLSTQVKDTDIIYCGFHSDYNLHLMKWGLAKRSVAVLGHSYRYNPEKKNVHHVSVVIKLPACVVLSYLRAYLFRF